MIFFISKQADAVALAIKMHDEGERVLIYIDNKKAKRSGDGLVPKCDTIREGLLQKPEIIIFDQTGLGFLADKLQLEGYNVIGDSRVADLLEEDRKFAMDVCKAFNIQVPFYKAFDKNSVQEAIQFLNETEKIERYVFKPHQDLGTDMTYISHGRDDMISFLEKNQERINTTEFELQEFIEGVEVSVECWYWQGERIPELTNFTFETKKFLAGDLGMQTGCMTSVVSFLQGKNPRLYNQLHKKLDFFFMRHKFCGAVDMNTIINERGIWFLEFTPRFGYNAIYCLFELLDSGKGDFFRSIVNRKRIRVKKGWAFGVRVSQPPFPFHETDREFGDTKISLPGLPSGEEREHIWLLDAYLNGEELKTVGYDGVVMEVTGFDGEDLRKLEIDVYEKCQNVEIANKQYRIDGIKNTLKRLKALEKLGKFDIPYWKYGKSEKGK